MRDASSGSRSTAASRACSSTSRDLVTCGGEQGLLSVAFAPDYARLGAALRQLHRRGRRHADGRVPPLGRRPGGRRSRQRPRAAAHRRLRDATTTAGLLLFGPDGRALRRDRRRRRRGRPRAHGPGPRQPARQAPADRSRARRLRPGGDRAAQPVALLVRPAARRSSGSATSARTRSRRSTRPRRARSARDLNFGWSAFEGDGALQRRPEAPGRPPAGARVQPRRRLLGDRRLRRPRPALCRPSPAATSTATSAPASCAASPPTRTAAASDDRALGPTVSAAELVRRGRRRARLRGLARRARCTGSSPTRLTGSTRRYPERMSDRRGRALIAATVSTAAVALTRRCSAAPRARPHAGAKGLGLAPIGNFTAPVYIDNAPGAPKLLFVVEQPGTIRVVRGGQGAQAAVPRHPRPGSVRRRAGAAVGRLRPPLREQPALLRLLRQQRRQHRGRRLPPRSAPTPTRAEARSRHKVIAIPHPHLREPQRRPAAVRARRHALHGHRRRRRRRRPGRQRAEPRTAARQAAADRPEAQPRLLDAAARTRSRAARARRDLRPRAAQPVPLLASTATPATSGSATSARTRGRRSTTCRAGGSPAPTSAGTSSRATTRSRAAARPPSYRPPVLEYSSRRRRNCAVTGGYVVRDPRCRRFDGRYVYADFCGGADPFVRSSTAPGRRTPPTGLDLDAAELVRRGQPTGGSTSPRWPAACPASSGADRPAPLGRPCQSRGIVRGKLRAQPPERTFEMESATQPATTAQHADNGASNGKPEAAETFEVHRPADGSVIRDAADRLAGRRRRGGRARCAPRSPPGRRSGSPGAGAGSRRCATGSSPTRTGSTT